MHPAAVALLRGVLAQGWKPLVSEYVCYHAKARIATRVDLICVDREGHLIFIETKSTSLGFTAPPEHV
jgi:RecB family endonuclease NucS